MQAELKKRDTVKSALTEENQRTLNLNKTLTKKNKDLRHNLEAEQTTCDALKVCKPSSGLEYCLRDCGSKCLLDKNSFYNKRIRDISS